MKPSICVKVVVAKMAIEGMYAGDKAPTMERPTTE